MGTKYGTNRVLEPKHVLPTSAWKLDNNRNIYPDEVRISLKRVHLEGTSFKPVSYTHLDVYKRQVLYMHDDTKRYL